MQQRDEVLGPQPGQRRLQLQRFVHRRVDELLDDGFSPRPQRTLAEAAAETLHAGDPDAVDFARIAVEHHDAGVDEDLADLVFLSRLVVVVAEHRDNRHGDASSSRATMRASSGRP